MKMVTQILTKYSVAKKVNKSKNILYRSPRIYLSTKLTDDSRFTFLDGQLIVVKIEGKKLIIENANKKDIRKLSGRITKRKKRVLGKKKSRKK
jgi:hypothetical protein